MKHRGLGRARQPAPAWLARPRAEATSAGGPSCDAQRSAPEARRARGRTLRRGAAARWPRSVDRSRPRLAPASPARAAEPEFLRSAVHVCVRRSFGSRARTSSARRAAAHLSCEPPFPSQRSSEKSERTDRPEARNAGHGRRERGRARSRNRPDGADHRRSVSREGSWPRSHAGTSPATGEGARPAAAREERHVQIPPARTSGTGVRMQGW